MEIVSSGNIVTINGNIKSISDFQNIKTTIESVKGTIPNITLILQDSISITSSVIGYLNKIILKDKINVTMKVGSEELMNLLDDLSLTQTFNARKV